MLQATSLPEQALDGALARQADLVVTDTYRRRIQTWFYAIRDTRGPTERAGETQPEPSGYDQRLDASPEVGDERRTVVEQVGGSVAATAAGGAARPEDRASSAVDGDLETAWRVGGPDPSGARLSIQPDDPITASTLRLIQPQDGPRDRVLTRARLHIDGGRPIEVVLDERSLTPEGQLVELPSQTISRLEVELVGTSRPSFDPALANAVGFSEVVLGDLRVTEVVRVPTDLLGRPGAARLPVDIVLTRLRVDPRQRGRQDQEAVLRRALRLPEARAFGLAGTFRVRADATDDAVASLFGLAKGGPTVTASSRLAGDLGSRAASAIDGDPTTAWQPDIGPQEGAALTVSWPRSTAVGRLVVEVVDTPDRSRITRLAVRHDDVVVGTVDVPPAAPGGGPTIAVDLPVPAGRVRHLTVVVDGVEERTAVPGGDVLPVAITEVTSPAIPELTTPTTLMGPCRPLLLVDGQPVRVRAVGSPAEARQGLDLQGCDGPLQLEAGDHVIESVDLGELPLDLDRLVLSSGADGAARLAGVRGTPRDSVGTIVERGGSGSDLGVELETDGDPFWLVLGQSDSGGWGLDLDGASVGPRRVVDGYGNGWLVIPDGPGRLTGRIRWEPQRLLWGALALSAMGALLCLVLVMRGRRAPPDPTAMPAWDPSSPALAAPLAGIRPLTPGAPALAVGVGVAALVVSTPLAAGLATVATLVGLMVPRATWAWAGLAAAGLLAARAVDQPDLAWLSLALLGADLVVDAWDRRSEVSRRRRHVRSLARPG